MFWLFVEENSTAMTNSLAERQLRKYITYRKKLLLIWSRWENEYVKRMLSLYISCRLANSSPFAQRSSCINKAV
jgi:hypothetical protein